MGLATEGRGLGRPPRSGPLRRDGHHTVPLSGAQWDVDRIHPARLGWYAPDAGYFQTPRCRGIWRIRVTGASGARSSACAVPAAGLAAESASSRVRGCASSKGSGSGSPAAGATSPVRPASPSVRRLGRRGARSPSREGSKASTLMAEMNATAMTATTGAQGSCQLVPRRCVVMMPAPLRDWPGCSGWGESSHPFSIESAEAFVTAKPRFRILRSHAHGRQVLAAKEFKSRPVRLVSRRAHPEWPY